MGYNREDFVKMKNHFSQMNAGDHVIFEYLGIDPESVLDHKLTKVDVSRMHKRDLQQGTAIKFQAIDEDISLWLRPRDSMLASDETPVYYAHYAPGYPNGVHFEKVIDAMKDVRQLLEDPVHYATVVLGTDDYGKTTVNGYLRSPRNNARLVISSLPDHIVKGFSSNQTSIDDLNDHTANLTYHVIVEINDEDDLQNIAGLHVNRLKTMSLNSTAAGNTTNNQNVDTLYPQILIQLDSTYNSQWSGRSLSLSLEYILSFWNGVDLIYRQVQNPKIRLNIAGIIIASDIRGTPFMWNNTLKADTSYDLRRVIVGAMSYYYSVEKKCPMVNFDAVAVMTKAIRLHFGGHQSKEHPRKYSGLGFSAGIGTICWRDDAALRHGAVVLITDNGGHSGIYTAAHEIGHLLGANHEGQATLRLNCTPTTDGSLMDAKAMHAINDTRFSDCGLEEIRKEFENGELACLYNVPVSTGTRLPGLMPGRISNAIEQCKAYGYGQTCFPNGTWADVCSKLWCSSTSDPNDCRGMADAASTGTTCLMDGWTEYGVCLKNRCISV